MSGQRTQWNEATRVQMPALVHLTRIGFTYFGKITEDKAGTVYDPDTNILIEVFKSQFAKLNPERAGEAEAMLRIIRQELDNDDIGESFYKRLKAVSPVRLIDFEHPENNTFHCSAEFTCKRDEDEFRPDITLFVNGLPLVFIEVKKPNNIGGMVAEAERMNKLRFPNKKFRRFINITQLMIFSNNMEYDAMGGIVPIQGVFYCTGSKKGSPFNCFREENPLNLDVAPYNRDFPYKDIDPEVEKQILSDFNNQVIHTSPEYQTNLRTTTPTNRVLTSMCSPDRLLFLLKYGITYYHKTKELDDGTIEQIDQKHIMRYQQFFAAMIVRERLHNIECYDPAAGTGTLLMALAHQIGEDRCTIFAQDRSQKSNKMLKLNLILNGLVSSLDHAIQGDTLTDPFHMSDDGKSLRQFDYEVCNPPFNLDFSETRETLAAMPARFWAGIPNVPKKKKESMSIYTCFLQHVLNSMKPNGKAAIVLPTGFLTAKSSVEGKLLKHIVNERLVYGVISMPSNVFANTGTNVSVVFFDNSKSSDKVILIDASKLGEEYQEGNNKKVRLTPSEIDMIVDTFLNKKTVEDFSVAVSYEDIEAKKCSLAAGQYFDVKVEYVELTQEEFESKMSELTSNLQSYFDEGNVLQKEIMEQLKRVKYEQI